MKKISHTLPTILGILGLLTLCACGQSSAPMADKMPKEAVAKIDYKPYPFHTSVVSDTKLDAQAVVFVQDGYEVKVSNQDEAKTYKKAPAQFLAKIRQAYADAKPYPLSKCVVCDMKLEDDALFFVYEGRQFKVCSDEDCYQVFQKDPAKYVKLWDVAAKSAATVTARYPFTGRVVAVVPERHALLIANEAVAGLMGAMTMEFTVDDPALKAAAKDANLTAELVREGDSLQLKNIKLSPPPSL